jgi:hypothetical protein
VKILRILPWVLLSAILVFGSAVYALADEPEFKDIPLQWKPTEDVRALKAIDLSVFKNAQFVIRPFNDLRKNPAEIGVNRERRFSNNDLLVTTKDHVVQWVTYQFSRTLSDSAIALVKDNGNFTLEADIVKFYVIEKSVYKGDVALKIRLLSKSNALLWEGMISGDSTRFGRSYQVDNYYECLSNAVIFAVHSLLQNDSFKLAVQKGK